MNVIQKLVKNTFMEHGALQALLQYIIVALEKSNAVNQNT